MCQIVTGLIIDIDNMVKPYEAKEYPYISKYNRSYYKIKDPQWNSTLLVMNKDMHDSSLFPTKDKDKSFNSPNIT